VAIQRGIMARQRSVETIKKEKIRQKISRPSHRTAVRRVAFAFRSKLPNQGKPIPPERQSTRGAACQVFFVDEGLQDASLLLAAVD
jgi:hypothetical protein